MWPNVVVADLEQRVLQVISSMAAQSLEVQDKEGHWYVLRLRPYKTMDNRIDGVVMTCIDIDSVKDAESLRRALQQERRLAAVVRDSSDAVSVQDFSGNILAWNRRATELYGYSEEEALAIKNDKLLAEKSLAEMKTLLQQLRQGTKQPPCVSWRRKKNGSEFQVWITTSILFDESGQPATIAFTEREIT